MVVVQNSEQRLEGKKCEQYDSDDWVCVVQRVEVLGHPDTDSERRGVEDEAEDLEQAVDPPKTWERGDTDHDSAHWEEEAECQCGEDGVCGDDDTAAIGIF